jgi:hypothetical protein
MPLSSHLTAQDFEELISGSEHDANYLMNGYVSPFLKAIGAGFNQGWYNTAKPHKKFGVDLTISVAAVGVPEADHFFTVDNSKLETIYLATDHRGVAQDENTGKGKVPTLFGSESTQSTYDNKSPTPSSPFDGIGGFDVTKLPMGRMPAPVVNLGIGLPWNTDIKFRFATSGGLSDEIDFSLWGFGIMHDIKQHIPGIKALPFDLSGFVGYTHMGIEAELDDPSHKGEFVINATTVQGLISKKISVLTFYGGMGYNFSKSTLKATGEYDLDDGFGNVTTVKDPVDLSASLNGPRMTAGMRLKLAVFTFHGDYTFQKYSTLTLGFGISVR